MKRKRLGCVHVSNDLMKSKTWPLIEKAMKPWFKLKELKRGDHQSEMWGYSVHFPYRGYEGVAVFEIDSLNGELVFCGTDRMRDLT